MGRGAFPPGRGGTASPLGLGRLKLNYEPGTSFGGVLNFEPGTGELRKWIWCLGSKVRQIPIASAASLGGTEPESITRWAASRTRAGYSQLDTTGAGPGNFLGLGRGQKTALGHPAGLKLSVDALLNFTRIIIRSVPWPGKDPAAAWAFRPRLWVGMFAWFSARVIP